MKKRLITISGLPGSGKSSTANKVAELLGYQRFSSGDFLRGVAASRGLTIGELLTTAESQQEIDHEIDSKLAEMGTTENNMVIDSRLAFHWIPTSFKVFLSLDLAIAAQRLYNQIQQEGRTSQHASSIDEVHADIEHRIASDRKRYTALYNLDYTDPSNYDLIVDSGTNDIATSAQLIIKSYQEWLEK
jgi:CMP/dCMP kinase